MTAQENIRTDLDRLTTPEDVRVFRARHRLSQLKLADLLHQHDRTVQAWERVGGSPPPYLWRALEHLEAELATADTTPPATASDSVET